MGFLPSTPSTDTHTGNQTHLPPTTEVDTGNQTHPTLSTGGDTGNQAGLPPSTSNSTPPTPPAKGDTSDRTDLPPSRELRIITDKALRIDQRTAVSTISLPLAVFVEISWRRRLHEECLKQIVAITPFFSINIFCIIITDAYDKELKLS